MSGSDDVGALVVLRPAAGETDEPITAQTIERHRPDPDEAERVRSWFVEEGFTVGPIVGVSFSIVAPAERMSAVFPGLAAGAEQQLSAEALPHELRGSVRAVTTEAPPDFGPGNP